MKWSTSLYIVANLVGLPLCVFLVAGIIATAKQEQRDYYDVGDSIRFYITVLPIFLLCVLINLGWGVKALADVFRRRGYHASLVLVVVAAAWVASYLAMRLLA